MDRRKLIFFYVPSSTITISAETDLRVSELQAPYVICVVNQPSVMPFLLSLVRMVSHTPPQQVGRTDCKYGECEVNSFLSICRKFDVC